MHDRPHIHIDPIDVAGRLDELDVRAANLIEAVQYGAHFVYESTANDPRASLGMLAWGKTNRGLRDRLVPEGWDTRSERGYELTIHPTLNYGIAVSSGDAYTGQDGDFDPSTSSDKGQATRDIVKHNGQLSFATIAPDEFPDQEPPPHETWLLLYCIDEERDEVRLELSRPKAMTDNRVTSWYERIILRPQAFGRPPSRVFDDRPDEGDGHDAVEVTVEKKAQAG